MAHEIEIIIKTSSITEETDPITNMENRLEILWKKVFPNINQFSNFKRIFKNTNEMTNSRSSEHKCATIYEYPPLPDEEYVIKDCDDEYILFTYYYEKLVETDMISQVINEVTSYFNFNDVTKYGCMLAGSEVKMDQKVVIVPLELPEMAGKSVNVPNGCKKIIYKDNLKKTLIAIETIEEGEPIIIEKADAFTKFPNCECQNGYYYECIYCHNPLTEFLLCEYCDVAIFCSIACKKKAIDEYHSFECKGLRSHFFAKMDASYLAFRMMVLGSHCGYDFDKKDAPYANEYEMIYDLPIKLDDFNLNQRRRILRRSVQLLVYLIEYTNFFHYLTEIDAFPNTTLYEKYLRIGAILVRHCCQTVYYVSYIGEEEFSYLLDTKGENFNNPVIFATSARIEHKCDANAQFIYRRNKCIIKALRKIYPGENISVNHYSLDNFTPYYKKRNFLLNRKIVCHCKLCVAVYNTQYGRELYKCPDCYGRVGKLEEDIWFCYKCEKAADSVLMNQRREHVEKIYNYILLNNHNVEKESKAFIMSYPGLYYNISLEYIDVVLEYIFLIMKQGNTFQGVELGFNLIELIRNNMHKYSSQKLQMLTKMANGVIACTKEVKTGQQEMLSLAIAACEEMKQVSEFYCYTGDWELLRRFIKFVVNFCLDEEKGSGKQIDAYVRYNKHLLRRNGAGSFLLNLWNNAAEKDK